MGGTHRCQERAVWDVVAAGVVDEARPLPREGHHLGKAFEGEEEEKGI